MRRSIGYLILIASIMAAGCGCSAGGDPAAALPQPTEAAPSPTPATDPTPEEDYRAPLFVPGLYRILPSSAEVIEIDLSGYVYGIEPESDAVTWTAESTDD